MTMQSKRIPFLAEPKSEVGSTELKNRCLEILDAVERLGIDVTITKHRKPIAIISPARRPPFKAGWAKGLIEVTGDIVSPLYQPVPPSTDDK